MAMSSTMGAIYHSIVQEIGHEKIVVAIFALALMTVFLGRANPRQKKNPNRRTITGESRLKSTPAPRVGPRRSLPTRVR